MGEQWRIILGSDHQYEISSYGNLRRKIKPREDNNYIHINHDGYQQVSIRYDGVWKTKRIARLVAEAFLPNTNSLAEVNHINSIRNDDRVENLEWCSRSQNVQHSFSSGNKNHRGENNSKSILKKHQVLEIRNRFKNGDRQIDLAKEYGVKKGVIHSIVKRRTWKHI